MQLTDAQIIEYQKIYKRHYGKEIGRSDALENSNNLINFFKIILRPIPVKEVDEDKK